MIELIATKHLLPLERAWLKVMVPTTAIAAIVGLLTGGPAL